MTITQFIENVKQTPNTIQFQDTMAVIEEHYDFTPTAFTNGETHNEAGQNSGSCKLFSFAKLHNLDTDQTLACFGDYYREDVLKHPNATDHQNIRNFIQNGWEGISFSGEALSAK
ncbi:HopJ type III effector protein [Aquimarina sp. 2201CG1-2-11]|uniref:HopJ type III effector protein n=1 Tax=Aquimarina discodermiae TaxID=3231043 RepID=UPI00346238C0